MLVISDIEEELMSSNKVRNTSHAHKKKIRVTLIEWPSILTKVSEVHKTVQII